MIDKPRPRLRRQGSCPGGGLRALATPRHDNAIVLRTNASRLIGRRRIVCFGSATSPRKSPSPLSAPVRRMLAEGKELRVHAAVHIDKASEALETTTSPALAQKARTGRPRAGRIGTTRSRFATPRAARRNSSVVANDGLGLAALRSDPRPSSPKSRPTGERDMSPRVPPGRSRDGGSAGSGRGCAGVQAVGLFRRLGVAAAIRGRGQVGTPPATNDGSTYRARAAANPPPPPGSPIASLALAAPRSRPRRWSGSAARIRPAGLRSLPRNCPRIRGPRPPRPIVLVGRRRIRRDRTEASSRFAYRLAQGAGGPTGQAPDRPWWSGGAGRARRGSPGRARRRRSRQSSSGDRTPPGSADHRAATRIPAS